MHAQENYWFSNAEKHDSFSHILFVASAKGGGRSHMWRENLWFLCARETLIFALPPDYKLVHTQKSICYECYNFTAAHQDAKHTRADTLSKWFYAQFILGFTLNISWESITTFVFGASKWDHERWIFLHRLPKRVRLWWKDWLLHPRAFS